MGFRKNVFRFLSHYFPFSGWYFIRELLKLFTEHKSLWPKELVVLTCSQFSSSWNHIECHGKSWLLMSIFLCVNPVILNFKWCWWERDATTVQLTGTFYPKLFVVSQCKQIYSVELSYSRTPRYLEQNWISLFFFSSHLLWAILNSVTSNTHYLKLFLAPLSSTLAILNFITVQRHTGQHQSGSAVKAPPDKMYRKLRKVLTCSCVTKTKSDWLDLTLRMQKVTSCQNFVNFWDQTITPEMWWQSRYLEPPLSRTISRYPWEFEIAGFYCTSHMMATQQQQVLNHSILATRFDLGPTVLAEFKLPGETA